MNEELVVYDQRPLQAAEVRAQVNLIQEVMKAVMQKDQHYGVIPGAGTKPTLLKPGAEKLMATFRLAADPVVEDLSAADHVRYRITCKLIAQSTGIFVGAGVGEASSEEEKYKWRFAVCDAEWNDTPEDRRRIKYKKDGSTIKQVRTNPADVANTILKMAKKRALVDAVLTVTGASDIFTQDIEDMPAEILERGAAQGAKPPIQQPQAKQEGEETLKIISGVDAVNMAHFKKKDGSQGTKYIIHAGEKYETFSETYAKDAKRAHESGLTVEIEYAEDKFGRKVKAMKVLEPEEAA